MHAYRQHQEVPSSASSSSIIMRMIMKTQQLSHQHHERRQATTGTLPDAGEQQERERERGQPKFVSISPTGISPSLLSMHANEGATTYCISFCFMTRELVHTHDDWTQAHLPILSLSLIHESNLFPLLIMHERTRQEEQANGYPSLTTGNTQQVHTQEK